MSLIRHRTILPSIVSFFLLLNEIKMLTKTHISEFGFMRLSKFNLDFMFSRYYSYFLEVTVVDVSGVLFAQNAAFCRNWRARHRTEHTSGRIQLNENR